VSSGKKRKKKTGLVEVESPERGTLEENLGKEKQHETKSEQNQEAKKKLEGFRYRKEKKQKFRMESLPYQKYPGNGKAK